MRATGAFTTGAGITLVISIALLLVAGTIAQSRGPGRIS
jgi:hypothetical protein